MLEGFDVTITQKGQIFTVSGADVTKLYDKLKSAQISYKGFNTGELKDGVFTLEKSAPAQKAAVN